MSARIIDGKAIAEDIRAQAARAVATLKTVHGIEPGIAVVLVGEDPASQVYVRNKDAAVKEAGMRSFQHTLDAATSQDDLLALIARLNADPAVHGILVQLPLPEQIHTNAVIAAIDPAKDVDGFHIINAGLLATGQAALVPCTPTGCAILAERALGDITGLEVVVVGRSNIVGRPAAQLFLNRNCTVTMAHSRTRDLPAVCRRADILIAAVGRKEMIRGDWIKPGACVIDVGITRVPREDGKTRLVGDVAFDEAKEVAGAITPVPGGVGRMTVAMLLVNTITAACRAAGIEPPDIG
jgi:methylenetetrahydrofolate dehydrogenase (NADP+) / methenyltetrahydrofolate cyclohydrolase